MPYVSNTAFVSATFGGADTFTVGAGTTVYAGFVFPTTADTYTCPIGSTSGSHWSGFIGNGLAQPVVGTAYTAAYSGGTAYSDSRAYDFSVTVTSAGANESGAVVHRPDRSFGLPAR